MSRLAKKKKKRLVFRVVQFKEKKTHLISIIDTLSIKLDRQKCRSTKNKHRRHQLLLSLILRDRRGESHFWVRIMVNNNGFTFSWVLSEIESSQSSHNPMRKVLQGYSLLSETPGARYFRIQNRFDFRKGVEFI